MNTYISQENTPPYPKLIVHSKNLENNLGILKRITPPKTKILIPVKANAYGCGIQPIMDFINENSIEYIGVANIKEAQITRQLGYKNHILLLGSFYPEDKELLLENNIIPSITSIKDIQILNQLGIDHNKKISTHLKLDLGMGRLGIIKQNISNSITLLQKATSIHVIGIYTHFPCANEPNDPSTRKHIQDFNHLFDVYVKELLLERSQILKHSANSAACMQYTESHYDMIRPGLMFYGYFSSVKDKEKLHKQFPIKPCLSLHSSPICLRTLHKGNTVSYTSSYIIQNDNTPVGVFPIGYADGIPHILSNKITFEKFPLIGNVTMDQIILKGVSSETPVEIIGPHSPPLEKWAELSNTITYQILTNLGHRFPRILQK